MKEFNWRIKAMRKAGWSEEKIKDWFISIFGMSEKSFEEHLVGKKTKTYIQKKKECYFCSNTKIIKHHIVYDPEILIYLCQSCHNKIHFIIKTSKNVEKEKHAKIPKPKVSERK